MADAPPIPLCVFYVCSCSSPTLGLLLRRFICHPSTLGLYRLFLCVVLCCVVLCCVVLCCVSQSKRCTRESISSEYCDGCNVLCVPIPNFASSSCWWIICVDCRGRHKSASSMLLYSWSHADGRSTIQCVSWQDYIQLNLSQPPSFRLWFSTLQISDGRWRESKPGIIIL